LYGLANFATFETEEGVLPNLREYTLANSIYWALCEGHACEISARRNAMDVSILSVAVCAFASLTLNSLRTPPRTPET
jgi:hypothetical protein